jgi:anti-sigma B factor antagonist
MAWRVKEEDQSGHSAVIEVGGVIDFTNVEDFFAFINGVLKRGIIRIVLDLGETSYLSSGGLSVIIDAYKRADNQGGKLVIVGASEMIGDLFDVVQFRKIIEFYDNLEEALEAI